MKTQRLLILSAALIAGAAHAGEARGGRTELTVLGGVSLLDASFRNDVVILIYPPVPPSEERLGGSPVVGFKLGRSLGERASAELQLSVAPSHTAESTGYYCNRFCVYPATPPPTPTPAVDLVAPPPYPPPLGVGFEQRAAYHYSLGFAYELTGGNARPYLGASAGAATFDGIDDARTQFELGLTAGVALGAGTVRGRLEAVDLISPHHFFTRRTEHDVQVRAGLSVRLP